MGLSNEERGIYITLVAFTWANGPLKNDLEVINSIVQGGDATKLVLARFFEANEQGKLHDPWLEEQRKGAEEAYEKKKRQTAPATAARKASATAAREAQTEPLRDRNVNVTSTEVEVEVEVEVEIEREQEKNEKQNQTVEVEVSNVPRFAPSLVKALPIGEGTSRPAPDSDEEKRRLVREARELKNKAEMAAWREKRKASQETA
jgi:uncharacterized protein YdaU (DUF1376 family)